MANHAIVVETCQCEPQWWTNRQADCYAACVAQNSLHFLSLLRSDAAGRPPLSYHIAKKLVFKKVRKALGLDRCSKCYTGAAPITKDTLEFFLSLDIPLYELYGMSECTGPHTISRPEAFKLTRYVCLFTSNGIRHSISWY